MSETDERPAELTITAGRLTRLTASLVWIVPAAVTTVAIARAAVWLQQTGMVSVLSPIVLGGLLGACIFGLAAIAGAANRRNVAAAAIALALVYLGAEHLFFYLDYRAAYLRSAASDPKALFVQAAGGFQPASFGEFIQASARQSAGALPNWLWWTIDAALTMVACIGVVVITSLRNANRPGVGPNFDRRT